jgi:hypothetical protein
MCRFGNHTYIGSTLSATLKPVWRILFLHWLAHKKNTHTQIGLFFAWIWNREVLAPPPFDLRTQRFINNNNTVNDFIYAFPITFRWRRAWRHFCSEEVKIAMAYCLLANSLSSNCLQFNTWCVHTVFVVRTFPPPPIVFLFRKVQEK